MNLLQDVQKLAIKKKMPDVQPGYTVKVHQKIKEGEKERVQIFEGLVIKMNSGYGADKTFTVRRIVSGVGVEKIFPLYSSNIVKIEVKKKSKVRRAKLYYMRDRAGKSARLKETFVSDKELEESIEELAKDEAKRAESEQSDKSTETSPEAATVEDQPAQKEDKPTTKAEAIEQPPPAKETEKAEKKAEPPKAESPKEEPPKEEPK